MSRYDDRNFMADNALTVVSSAWQAEEEWRVLVSMIGVIESLRNVSLQDDEDSRIWSDNVLKSIICNIMYSDEDITFTEEYVEDSVKSLKEWLDEGTEELKAEQDNPREEKE